MANLLNGEVEVEIGGEPRILRFSFGALAEAQQMLGLASFDQLVTAMAKAFPRSGMPDMDVFWTFLVAGLKEHWPEAGKEAVQRMVLPRDFGRIMLQVERAIGEAFPKRSDFPDEKPAEADPPTAAAEDSASHGPDGESSSSEPSKAA